MEREYIMSRWYRVLCVAETGDTGYFEGSTVQYIIEAAEEEFGCHVQQAEIVDEGWNIGVEVYDGDDFIDFYTYVKWDK